MRNPICREKIGKSQKLIGTVGEKGKRCSERVPDKQLRKGGGKVKHFLLQSEINVARKRVEGTTRETTIEMKTNFVYGK